MAGRAGRVMWAEGIVVQDWRGIHTLPLPCSSWCACARREQLELELGNGAGGSRRRYPTRWFPLPSPLCTHTYPHSLPTGSQSSLQWARIFNFL